MQLELVLPLCPQQHQNDYPTELPVVSVWSRSLYVLVFCQAIVLKKLLAVTW
jgi:hypothetical protein